MIKTLFAALALVPVLTGCLGNMALSNKAKQVNLELTEHRWGREGIFLAFQICYVYRVCMFLDLIVFNSIEFWNGENPINGKKAVVDLPMEVVEKMGMPDVAKAQIERIDSNTAKLYISFIDGDKVTYDVIRNENTYAVSYLGKEYFQGEIVN